MDYLEFGYFGLFIISFLAATILPLTSEAVLLLFLASGFDPMVCLLVATIGNSLGGVSNYGLGMIGHPEKMKARFKNPRRFIQVAAAVRKYGYWLGLLSWTPILGDPLTIVLGYFRVRFIPFLLLMVLGKFVRYWLITFIWNQ